MAAAGSAAVTEIKHTPVKKIKWVWTSDASGNVSGGAGITVENNWCGKLIGVATVPGTAGVQPTTYGVTIKDADGIDLALGNITTRSTTATEFVGTASLAIVAASTLELGISGAGNAKQGTVYLYIQ